MKKITDAMRDWLLCYLDGEMNGVRSKTNSVYTRGSGSSRRGLKTCCNRGLIISVPDDTLNAGGWRHDITLAGREAVDMMQVEVDQRRADWKCRQQAMSEISF